MLKNKNEFFKSLNDEFIKFLLLNQFNLLVFFPLKLK